MPSRLLPVGACLAACACAGAPAEAAVITTDRPCYVESMPMQIAGTGFAPGSAYAVRAEKVFAFGNADATGSWLARVARAPDVPQRTTTPRRFALTATQDGVDVATTRFDVVNLLVTLASTRGKPTSRTTWRLSGFTPGASIYVHVRRSRKTLADVRLGRGDARCGRLTARQRRIPGVKAARLRTGRYDLYIDNRATFRPQTRPQYRSSVSIHPAPR
ncbi:hypothetical protein [Paraconexibacter sp.]|uniref:hypothetical protein n=1 Tax=Paraconexibacter sp. TaxID=2949640 RepID=UPI00356373EB